MRRPSIGSIRTATPGLAPPSVGTGWSIGRRTPPNRMTRVIASDSRTQVRRSTPGPPGSSLGDVSRSSTTMRSTCSSHARSSSRWARSRRSRTSPVSTRRRRGPTSRRPSHGSCLGASWSWAAAHPDASWPRATPGSACRSRSSTRVGCWRRRCIRAMRRSSGARSSVTAWTVRTGVRATGVRAGMGTDGAHVLDLADGSSVEGHAILLAVGRTIPLRDLGLEQYGIDGTARTPIPRDGRMRVTEGLLVAGDAGRPRDAHPPRALPGGARRAAGRGTRRRARLPRASTGDVHGP